MLDDVINIPQTYERIRDTGLSKITLLNEDLDPVSPPQTAEEEDVLLQNTMQGFNE